MLAFMIRRVLTMVLTALCLTFVVFYLTNLPPNLEKLAKSEASARMSDADVESWIDRNGYGRPVLVRYAEWLGITPGWTRTEDGVTTGRCIERGQDPAAAPLRCGVLQGDWGFSTVFKQPVSQIIAERLGATGMLMLWVMIVMVPASLLIGVLSGMREGSRLDRGLSIFSIASTATPEYVSGVVLIALFASTTTGLSPWLAEQGWISGKTLFLGTATSALDSRTEQAIQATLRRVRQGRTTLVVAHRLSTIADADEILVLKAGRVVERGTHQALITLGGEYASLWRKQTRKTSGV
jgi:peptide/nickel transport system permease protein